MRQGTSRLLSALLVLCMALALLPGAALAAETSGTCGDGVTWTYADGALSIQGAGRINDYYSRNLDVSVSAPWEEYEEEIHTVSISDGVTAIGNGAFLGFHSLTAVTIPASVSSIGDSVFLGCGSLTSVIIPDGVPTIGELAFGSCESLTSVTIPASVTNIVWGAFADCSSLADVYYGGSEDQWKQIDIDETDGYNDALLSANIHYNGAAPAPSAGTGPAPAPSAGAGISVTVGGNAVTWTDAAPFIDENDRTMVPLRAVADAMSLEVSWDGAAREASFTDGSKTIIFPIDSTSARTSDGDSVQMDTAAVIANERTYAPIRYLAEFFGYAVDWNGASQTVIIE